MVVVRWWVPVAGDGATCCCSLLCGLCCLVCVACCALCVVYCLLMVAPVGCWLMRLVLWFVIAVCVRD